MKGNRLLTIVIAVLMAFGLASLIATTFTRPCPAAETYNRHCASAFADELGCDYTAVHDIHGGAANDLDDFLTEHLSARCSCVEQSAASGLFAQAMPTTADDTLGATRLPPPPDCTCTATDVHHLNADSILTSMFPNPADLTSLPGWYWCAAYDNYAPSGMPDFDQRQDNWKAPGTDSWTFCGPTALANCFWWLDSRYADPAGVPGDGNDTFPLVRDYGGATDPVPGPKWDDHNSSNVNDPATQWPPGGPPPTTPAFVPGPQPQPSGLPAWGELVERLAWYVDCDGIRTGRDLFGTYPGPMELGITQWLQEEGLSHMLEVTSVRDPDFYFMAEAVESGDCVILQIGWWWEEDLDVWRRPGGHYVTVAGVNTSELLIAISDPSWNQTPPDDFQHHNDAAIVSHDIWRVDLDSRGPDGWWGLPDYAVARFAERYPDRSIYALVELTMIIVSVPPLVVTQPSSAIGTTSVSLNMSYTHGDQTALDLRFVYREAQYAEWIETAWIPASIPWVFLSGEGIHGETLVGLSSNTAYEFRGELRYDEIIIEGEVLTFTTEKIDPIVNTQVATDISTDSATLNMNSAVGDYSPVEVRFKWRESGTGPWSETAWTRQESDGMHVEVLSELDPDTFYEFKAQLTYDYPPLVIEGGVSSFTTRARDRCFIATAAYGTPMAEEVQILREFRDGYLLTNPVGQSFVDSYYGVSPPIAEFIAQHPRLKPIVRAGLVPAVTVSTIIVNGTPSRKPGIAGLVVLVSVTLAVWAARRRRQAVPHA